MSAVASPTRTRKPRAPKPAAEVPVEPAAEVPVEPAAEVPVEEPEAPSAKYVACKKLTVSGRTVYAGEPVPEAESWPRVETWVRHGYIREA